MPLSLTSITLLEDSSDIPVLLNLLIVPPWIRSPLSSLVIKSGLLTKAVWANTVAWLANPMVWVPAIIMAVVTAVVLMYNKFEINPNYKVTEETFKDSKIYYVDDPNDYTQAKGECWLVDKEYQIQRLIRYSIPSTQINHIKRG